ncbi:unnamed protein product [Caenorhabditis bovis]|uniref:Uncharacterized protein n=1 Tax=Caenorhabditis bovis TaxID=2654633 RepID=A0A8S1ES43_9PELO|nr:unnamed protein product [Caenorhabditis bovis]
MELSQEVVSIVVLVTVCVSLSLLTLAVWLCACRRDKIRAAEHRAIQLDRFETAQKNAKTTTMAMTAKIGERQTARIEQKSDSNELNKEYNLPRNRRLDTISEMAISSESLQRNDSKTNVFNVSTTTSAPSLARSPNSEVDLNPGLDNSISLEKI